MTTYTIRSQEEFRRLLNETEVLLRGQLEAVPDYPAFQSIHRQLEAILAWTAPGQTPAPEQKARVNFGLITARELDGSSDAKIQDLANRLHALSGYFDRSF